MYVVHENKSLINAKKSSVTSMSDIKLRERKKNYNKKREKKKSKHMSIKSRS